MIVLDASVLLKRFLLNEADRPQALQLFKRHLEGEDLIAVPDLAFYEIANTFVVRTPLPPEEIQKNLDELQSYQFQIALFSELPNVASIARRYGLTIYDAAYVTLAQTLRCSFVTADERLLARLKGVPHMVHLKGLAH